MCYYSWRWRWRHFDLQSIHFWLLYVDEREQEELNIKKKIDLKRNL